VPTSRQSALKRDAVPFVEWSGELFYAASLSGSAAEAKGNRVLIGRMKLRGIDPKPGDLPMGRLKWR